LKKSSSLLVFQTGIRAFTVWALYTRCDEGDYGGKAFDKLVCQVLEVSARMTDRAKQRFIEEGVRCLP
jgi:hypothetical protein